MLHNVLQRLDAVGRGLTHLRPTCSSATALCSVESRLERRIGMPSKRRSCESSFVASRG